MPEQPDKWPRGVPWTLMNAHNAGQVARITCRHCNIKRYYKPAELREVYGNVPIAALRANMRCVACGKSEYIDAELTHLNAEEAVTVRLRRLVEIRFVRRVIWRDEE
jgi:DNA-directed RNA polymerase subunit RPC12/RpoP